MDIFGASFFDFDMDDFEVSFMELIDFLGMEYDREKLSRILLESKNKAAV
jgi:hypothetical protein